MNGSENFTLGLDYTNLINGRNAVIGAFNDMNTAASQFGNSADEIDAAFGRATSNIQAALGTIGIATSLAGFAHQVMTIRGEFQQLEVAFDVMLGSEEKANNLMKELVNTAATTPLDLQGVANGAKQLLAYGTNAEEVSETLVRLGNIAAGLSIPLNDLVYLYGTTQTQGRLFTQDLRQFMGRGIPLADELAKQFGVTVYEVGELVTAGKVGFPQVKTALEAMTNEGGKFENLMARQSKTISGQISNIEDAIDVMFNDIGKSSEGAISSALDGVSLLVENYEKIGAVLLEIAAGYGTYKAALAMTSAYHNILARQTTAIETQRQASLASLYEETAATMTNATAEEEDAMAKRAAKSAIDAKIVALEQELQANLANAEANVEAMRTAQVRAAMYAEEVAQKRALLQLQYELNASTMTAEQEEAAAIELNTVASEENAAAKASRAATAEFNAAVQAKEAAATKLSSFQSSVDTIEKTKEAAATGLLASASAACSKAFASMKAAFAANPFGVTIMALTTVIGLFTLLRSEEEETEDVTKRFNDAISGDSTKLLNFKAALENCAKGTKMYTDAVNGLVSLGKDYNVTIETENGNIKDLAGSYDRLTQAIKAQAAQKLLVEAQSKANEDAMKAEKKAMDSLMEAAKNTKSVSMTYKNGQSQYVTEELNSIQNITSASWALVEQEVMSNAEAISAAFAKSGKEGEKAIQDEVEKIKGLLASFGASSKDINAFESTLVNYVRSASAGFKDAYSDLDRTKAQMQGLTDATANLKDATKESVDVSKMSFEQLKEKQSEVEQKIKDINDKTINPTINFEELNKLKSELKEINDLLPKQLVKGTDAELEKRLQDLKKQRSEVANGSLEWNILNNQIGEVNKTLLEHKKAYAENKDKSSNSKKGKTKEQLANEAEQLRKQTEQYERDKEQYARQQSREQTDMEFEAEQERINTLKDGEDKYRAQLDLNYQKNREKIKRWYEDIRLEKIEQERKLWEENPANKGKQFVYDPNDSKYAYTDAERNLYNQKMFNNSNEWNNGQDEVTQQTLKDWDEYLIAYGTVMEKKMGIANKYNKLIANAANAAQVQILKKEKEAAIDEVDKKEADAIEQKRQKAVQSTQRLISSFKDLGQALQEMDNGMAKTLGGIVDLGSQIGTTVLSTIEGIKTAGEASSVAMQTVEKASVILAAVSMALQIATKISEALSNDKKHEKNIEKLGKQIDSLERAYKSLNKEVEKTYSTTKQANIEAEIANRQQQIQLVQKQLEEERKKKKNKDTDQYINKIRDLQDEIAELREQSKDAIFGSDLKSAIDNFAEAYANAWENGTSRAKSAKDVVRTMMKQMVSESIKAAIQSSGQMEKLRTTMAEYFADGVLSTFEQRQLESIAETAAKELDKQFGGMNRLYQSGRSQDSTAGGFATASQDSVDELNGRFTAIQMTTTQIAESVVNINAQITAQSEHLAAIRLNSEQSVTLAMSAVDHLAAIEKNTHMLYDIHDKLDAIERNTHNI